MKEGNGCGFAAVAFDLSTTDVKHPSWPQHIPKGPRTQILGFQGPKTTTLMVWALQPFYLGPSTLMTSQHMFVPLKVKELYDRRQNL